MVPVYSGTDSLKTEAEMNTQVRHAARHTFYGEHPRVSLVPVVFGARSPHHVPGEVTHAIVRPLNRHSGARVSHVSYEVGKAKPFRTDRNSPASVILKVFGIGIGTSLDHRRPNPVDVPDPIRTIPVVNSLAHLEKYTHCSETFNI